MNMTWKEFKETLEKLGVKDEHEIDYIDIIDPLIAIDIYVYFGEGSIKVLGGGE